MPIINGLDRLQIRFSNLEDAINTDNDVRFIDAFVDKLDLGKIGVTSLTKSEKLKSGRASYADSLLLKLYLYAYLNVLIAQLMIKILKNLISCMLWNGGFAFLNYART